MSDPNDELGELSQDDIDQLMNSNVTSPVDSGGGDDFEDDDMELISQADIDRLMNPDTSSDEEKPEKEQLVEDDHVIDESEAVDVQDSLIAQETIDDLIKNFDNGTSSEPVILDEDLPLDPEPVTEPTIESTTESTTESIAEPTDDLSEPDMSEEMDLEDIEDFLKPDSDSAVFELDDSESEDVSQEDIDALLLDSDAGGEDEDDILISQDDIDTLLMTVDQEDEDVLGDLDENDDIDDIDDLVDPDEDEDILESDNLYDENDEDDDQDQVVLEEFSEEPIVESIVESGEDKKKPGSKWYKSKLVIACASALILLGITVPISYFLFFSGKPPQEVQSHQNTDIMVEVQREIEIETETVDINITHQGNIKKPGNMVLKNFVVLASDLSKDMGYITTDISIDYSDQKVYHEIMENLSFYRDVIYDSINKSLGSKKGNEVTQADILWGVETNLKKVLPKHHINKVSFKSFKAS